MACYIVNCIKLLILFTRSVLRGAGGLSHWHYITGTNF